MVLAVKRRKSRSVKRRKSRSIKRIKSRSIKRRKSRSGKRRKSKHTDNGLINDKDDNIKIELELLLKNEPVLFQDILSKIIGEKLNEEEATISWLKAKTDILNFFNLCLYGCYNIIKELFENIKSPESKIEIVGLESDIDKLNCYFFIIDGFDKYCFNYLNGEKQIDVEKRYYDLLDYLLNINDQKLTSPNIISDKETPINICFLNCLKYRKFLNIHDNKIYLNPNEFQIDSVSINRNLLLKLFIKMKEKSLNDLIIIKEFVKNQYETINTEQCLTDLTLDVVYDKLVYNKSDYDYNSFVTKRKQYYDNDSQFCKFILAKLNNMITKIKEKEKESEAEENMNKLLKEEELSLSKIKIKSSPKIRIESSPKIRTPTTTNLIEKSAVDEKIDSLSKYKEAFDLEITNIKVQTKTADSLSGILAITCFLKNYGDEEKEISLHGLWPNIDEKMLENYEHNKKINLNDNTVEPFIFRENNISCFSNFSPFFFRHEWNKHGVYANKYENIQDYLNESCELAKPILFFLIYMDQIKFQNGENYNFKNIINDVQKSLFHKYLIQVIDDDNYQELYFNVCANYDEIAKKYNWGFCVYG